MRLKKINAVLALLSMAALLLHVGYTVFCYLAFYYNPTLKIVTAIPFMVLACLHAVCGMAAVFMQADGTRLDLYPRLNMRTVLQRISAALIFPMLILHINTFRLMQMSKEAGNTFFLVLLLLSEPLFFGVVITHVSVSFSKALITVGWLRSVEKQRVIDRVVYILGAVIFAAAVFFILKGQIAMFFK